jgi:DNA (cytosine-5)-methyltransferase 1
VSTATHPVLLDLFCGEGGASMGYARAGFRLVGVDIKPRPRYPYEFHQADALTFPLEGFEAIHASPPCQRFSALNNGTWGSAEGHPDLIDAVRERLGGTGVPWVIENVPQAPLRYPLMLCGSMFGLSLPADFPNYLRRHRCFESSEPLRAPGPCRHTGKALGVYGHGQGGGPLKGRSLAAHDARAIMGMPWANRDGCSQAIPPAYTEWIGRQLMDVLDLAGGGWTEELAEILEAAT